MHYLLVDPPVHIYICMYAALQRDDVCPWLLWSLLQMMDKGQVKTYDSIQKLLNETSHLKQAISPAERLKLFPRRNSSMRTPQSKLSSVTQTLQEEAEDNIQDTRLWPPQTGIHTETIKLTMLSKWYIILDDLSWEHLTFIMKKMVNVTRGTQCPLRMGHTVRPGITEHCKKKIE